MSIESTDQIADLLTRIRNAIMVGKNDIYVPTSKLKVAIIDSLKKSGYLYSYEVVEHSPRNTLHLVIAEPGKVAKINEINRFPNLVVVSMLPPARFPKLNLGVASSSFLPQKVS